VCRRRTGSRQRAEFGEASGSVCRTGCTSEIRITAEKCRGRSIRVQIEGMCRNLASSHCPGVCMLHSRPVLVSWSRCVLRCETYKFGKLESQTRISGEKRRLSELRTFHTPVKSNPGAASQQFFNSPTIYR
jgi:hypothetical protein